MPRSLTMSMLLAILMLLHGNITDVANATAVGDASVVGDGWHVSNGDDARDDGDTAG